MFGERLKKIRIEKGYTQAQLAEKLMTTQSTLGKYERGELQPSLETIKAICKVLDVSSDYLLEIEK